ncbi:MFS transporter [Ottowia oryzae]|uniref:MFS transporter n=1 Tax=Ottowia oryzae TaxID=2109914 RepID=A0A2S0MGC3_9BURK|nr:MFS transporter [Ottowia oryzae]AVO34801.1 MFS transporter [Ottowia oryzae]
MGKQTLSGSQRWLCGLNFFASDVRDGLGPFLGVFLMAHGWQADGIGYVMSAAGIAGMLATMPLGVWVDGSRYKRAQLAGATVLLMVSTLALWAFPSPIVTTATQVLAAVVGALFGPAIMGLSLGLVGPQGLARQLGRNEAWNHAGNLTAAALAGAAGYRWGLPAVFVLMMLMGVGALFCVWRIRDQDIDHDMARGMGPTEATDQTDEPAQPRSIWRVLTGSRDLRMLAITMMLFHLGNAAMLPLLGQAVVARSRADPSAFTAATIVVAQLVMIPVALLAGRYAERHGYGWLVTVALAALPLRGAVAALWPSPWAVIPVQVLDGVGAGLLGVALPGLVERSMRGSGHVNAGLGAVMTIQGIGASLSPALGGWVAHRFGYGTAFGLLGAASASALVVFVLAKMAAPSRGATAAA